MLWVSTNSNSWYSYFLQTADIDASATLYWNQGAGFSPIGNPSNNFGGSYDGDGYTISNLYIYRPNTNRIGLFGYIGGNGVKDLINIGLDNVDIRGGSNVGGLVGYLSRSVSITNCYCRGEVYGTYGEVGGLIGIIDMFATSSSYNTVRSTTIERCFFEGNVTGDDYLGGLIGSINEEVHAAGNVGGINSLYVLISECFTKGNVTGNNIKGGLIGGTFIESQVGYNVYYYYGSQAIGNIQVQNCYSFSNVIGNIGLAGGLIGFMNTWRVNEGIGVVDVDYSYSTGNVSGNNSSGGLVGTADQWCTVHYSFWDTETSEQSTSDGGTGKTSTQMKDIETFTNLSTVGLSLPWDFLENPFDDTGNEDFWDIDITYNDGYPFLRNHNLLPNFTAPATAFIGEAVQFVDTSTGNPTNWEWDFENDGTIDSYEQNPQWIYTLSGAYSVSLTISDGTLSDTIIKPDFITVNPYPNPSIVVAPETTDFGNVSINETATLQITVHNYGAEELIISNIISSTDRFSVSIVERESRHLRKKRKPELNFSSIAFQENNQNERDVSFSISPLGTQILDVNFSPSTVEEINGSLFFLTNDPQNSMLTYAVSGTGYNFYADFVATPLTGDIPLLVEFTNNSVGDIQSYLWDFGDGEISTLETPNHLYEEEGVFTVSLTINDIYHQKNQTQIDLISVVGHPILFSADSLGIDFGSLYLTDSSGDSLIVIQNIGTKAFQINSLSFVENTEAFNFEYSNLGIPILPNDSDTIYVNFNPSSIGTFSDHIFITNNSENFPNLEINLFGICEFALPLAPQNVQLNIVGVDGIISWDSVSENIYGFPLTPEGYLVYYNEIASGNEEDYYFLAFVENDTTYTHLNVARFSPQMFYKVAAYVDLTRAEIKYFKSLNISRNNVKISEINQNLRALRNSKN